MRLLQNLTAVQLKWRPQTRLLFTRECVLPSTGKQAYMQDAFLYNSSHETSFAK